MLAKGILGSHWLLLFYLSSANGLGHEGVAILLPDFAANW